MLKSTKLRHPITLIALLLFLQACTCGGTDIADFFPSLRGGTASERDNGPESGMDCKAVNLVYPRISLPNGMTTVKWDPLAGAINYRINVYSNGVLLKSWDAASPATSLSADLGQAAIGGANPYQLELLTFDANGNYCRDSVALNQNQAVASATPTQTPTSTPFPPVLDGTISYCVPSRDYYYANMPLRSGVDPEHIYNELVVSQALTVKIGKESISCTINKGKIPVLTCAIPSTTHFPVEVLVQYNDSIIQSFSYDGYCPNEELNNDPPSGDGDPSPEPIPTLD